jgi:hypothetical protein
MLKTPLFVLTLFSLPAIANDCSDYLKTLKPFIGKPASVALKKSGLFFFPEEPMPYGNGLFYRAHHDNTLGINLLINKKTGTVDGSECVIFQTNP